jgi:hypothetical protein
MLTQSDHADALPEAVFAVWADVAGRPAWDPEVRFASLDVPFAVVSRGRLVPLRGRPSRFEITELDAPARHVIEVSLPLASLGLVRSVAPQGGGARVVHSVAFTGPLGWLFARLLEPRFARALPSAVAGVCRRAEAGSAVTRTGDRSA